MEEDPRKTKPEEESSSPTEEDGSPLGPEPKRQRIAGEEKDGSGGGAGGGGGGAGAENMGWEAVAANATKDIAASIKTMEQILKTGNEYVAQLEANFGPDKSFLHSMHKLHWEAFMRNCEKHISGVKKCVQAVLNGLSQMPDKIEMMPHVPIDKEPVNSSLPDDAEVDSPNNSQ